MAAYPEYILKKLRQMEDLEETDTVEDEELQRLTPNEAFKNVCNWEGLIRYDVKIKQWVKDIYGVDLDEISELKIRD